MDLPVLKVNITVPDCDTTCETCGCRAEILADFWHTNYRGAIYECTFCDETTLFIDREDDYYSIDYWEMTEKQRGIYENFSTAQRRVFLAMKRDEKVVLLRLNKKQRRSYFNAKYKEIIDEYEDFLNSEFYEYVIYG